MALAAGGCATRAPPSASIVRSAPASADGAACSASAAFTEAAQRNALASEVEAGSPFGRPEVGWAIYAPLIAHEIGTSCSAGSPAFAAALSTWQRAQGQAPTGVLTPEQFEIMRQAWQKARPMVDARARGVCPDPPPEATLAVVAPNELYEPKLVLLRPAALSAYRAMVAAANRELPDLKDQPQMLTIFSGYRSPARDAARCEAEQNCDGVARAVCSPHRTGLAIDIVMGQAPGYEVDSSADPNRLLMSRTAAYHWMVVNAGRFGFVNYPFEPWHWEWTGEPVGG